MEEKREKKNHHPDLRVREEEGGRAEQRDLQQFRHGFRVRNQHSRTPCCCPWFFLQQEGNRQT